MARIRFAGRPSRRNRSPTFSSVYEHTESERHALDVLDPNTRLLVNIQRGLKHFIELAGPCDEGEFVGFDAEDIDRIVKKLSTLAALRKELESCHTVTRRKFVGDGVPLEFTGFSVRDIRQVEKRISALQALRTELSNSATIVSLDKNWKNKISGSVQKKASCKPGSVPKTVCQSVTSTNHVSPVRQSLKGNIKVRLVLGSRPLATLLSSTKLARRKKVDREKKTHSSSESDSESVLSEASSSAVKYCLPSKKSVLPCSKVVIPVRPVKTSVVARARQLLTKARCREARVESVQCPPPRWHGQIQLPQQSTRSSRKITLNKRFMDEGYTTFSQVKKPKLDESSVDISSVNTHQDDQDIGSRKISLFGKRSQKLDVKKLSYHESSTRGKLECQENIQPIICAATSRASKAVVVKARKLMSRTGSCASISLKKTDKTKAADENFYEGEAEKSKVQRSASRKANTCEICSNTSRVTRYNNCSVPVCRACFRFFNHFCKLLATGKCSDLQCKFGGHCKLITFNTSKERMCIACRFKSCLRVFPEEVYSKYSSSDLTPKTEVSSLDKSNEPSTHKNTNSTDVKADNATDQLLPSTPSVSSLDRPKRQRHKPAALDDMDCNSFETPDTPEKFRRNREGSVSHSKDNENVILQGTEKKTPSRRRSKSNNVLNSSVLPPSSFSLTGQQNPTSSHNSFERGLHNLFDGEDLMKFATSVDRSLNTTEGYRDLINNTTKCRLIDTRPDYYPADMAQSDVSNAFVPGEVEPGTLGGRGPRIKHVCRRAAVALGKPMALFPMAQSLSLSALPSQEKERVLDGTSPRTPESDGHALDEMKYSSIKSGEIHNSRQSSEQSGLQDAVEAGEEAIFGQKKRLHVNATKKFKPVLSTKTRHRRKRCLQCSGCLAPPCGTCESCKDMPKFGGRGVLKQACRQRVCLYLSSPDVTEKSVSKKSLKNEELGADYEDFETKCLKNIKGKRLRLGGIKPYKAMLSGGLGSKIYSGLLSAKSRPRLFGLKGPSQGSMKVKSEKKLPRPVSENVGKKWPKSASGQVLKKEKIGRRKQKLAVREEEKDHSHLKSALSSSLASMSSAASVADAPAQKTKIEKGITGTKFNPFNSQALQASTKLQHVIKVDCKEDMAIEEAWRNGVALISSAPLCVRAVCWLCGSLGQEPLIYCTVCCEPYHSFCLEENQRPIEGLEDTWCCQKCQYCCICYGQNNLLQCDKCQGCYHTHCIGPNYPTGRSRKKIWVCHKCVRCKSCGTTSPGPDPDSVWMYDFSLCMTCGQLMDKGNFCPVCQKCYVDDDWDSQMMQCSKCRRWVHSSCEQLTDEMYQVVVYMPEDVPFNCRVCCGNQPSTWELMVRQEMNNCMLNIMDAVMASKYVKQLRPVKNLSDDSGSSKTDACKSASEKLQPSDTGKPVSDSNVNNNAVKSLGNAAKQLDSDADSSISNSDVHVVSNSHDSHESSKTGTEQQKQLGSNTDSISETSVANDVDDVESVVTFCDMPQKLSLSSEADRHSSMDDEVESSITTRSQSSFYEAAQQLLKTDKESKFPTSLKEIERRLDLDDYKSVEEFARDMLRIIQYNASLTNNSESCKAGSLIREMFIKQLSKQFPWFNINNSKIWACDSTEKTVPRGDLLDSSVAPPSQDHIYAQWIRRSQPPAPVQLSVFKQPCFGQQQASAVTGLTKSAMKVVEKDLEQAGDTRHCHFCWVYGDCIDDEAGRLLYAGQDDWVHVNCALWSAEVYEEGDGSLQAVHTAMARGRKLRCDSCAKPGATVGCCQAGCFANYHFMCARRSKCSFRETKKVFCRLHRNTNDGELMEDGAFAMTRRTWVDVDGNRSVKRPWSTGLEPSLVNVLKGSLTVDSLGSLTRLSDTKSALLPAGYSTSRLFWSTVDPRRRCVYTCRIFEVVPKVVATSSPAVIKEITVSHDESDPNYNAALAASYCATSCHRSDDEDTESASEDDSISNSVSSPETSCLDDLPVSHASLAYANYGQSISSQYNYNARTRSVASANNSIVFQSFSRSFPGSNSMDKQKRVKKSLSVSSSGNRIKESPKDILGAAEDAGFSGLSQDTLKLLGIDFVNKQENSSVSTAVVTETLTAGGDDLLLSMAHRLNEAAARSSRSKSKLPSEYCNKTVDAGDGCCPKTLCDTISSESDSHLERTACLTNNDPQKASKPIMLVLDKATRTATFAANSELPNGMELSINDNIIPSVSLLNSVALLSQPQSGIDSLMRIDQTDGPPYETDPEDSDGLHLVADFSSDDESLALSTRECQLSKQAAAGSEMISNAMVDQAELCVPSTSSETTTSNGAEMQERCQVVLHDVLKSGLSLHGGICRLGSGVKEASDGCAASSTTQHDPGSAVNGLEIVALGPPEKKESSAVLAKQCIKTAPAVNRIIVNSSTQAGHGMSNVQVSSSTESPANLCRNFARTVSDVSSLISDIVACPPNAQCSQGNHVSMANVLFNQHLSSQSRRFSNSSPAVSTFTLGTTGQKINCIKIQPSSSASVTTSSVQCTSIGSLGNTISNIPYSKVCTSQVNTHLTQTSKVAMLRTVRAPVSSVSSAGLTNSGKQQLTMNPMPNAHRISADISSLKSQGGQFSMTSTKATSVANYSDSVRPCVTHVPLTSAVLQAGVRPVGLSANTSGSNKSATDGTPSPQVGTLQELLASARQTKPFFISVSPAEKTTLKSAPSFDYQQKTASGMQHNLKLTNSSDCNRVFATVNDVAVSQSDIARKNTAKSSQHERSSAGVPGELAHGATALTNASNYPTLSVGRRKLRAKLKDTISSYAKSENSQGSPSSHDHHMTADNDDEVRDSPLLAMFRMEEQRRQNGTLTTKKDVPHLMFEITSDDGFSVLADSFKTVWRTLTDKVQDARLSVGMQPVSFTALNGLEMYGLTNPTIVYLIEQLYGAHRCSQYDFRFNRSLSDINIEEEDDLVETQHGCSRAEPFTTRKPHDMFAFLLSRYRMRPSLDQTAAEDNNFTNNSQRRTTSLDLPMAMRFRALPRFAREAVGVYQSPIHGRGLFCRRALDAGEMIIEYSGEMIRAILCDKRENSYEARGIGCYMFRKDRDYIIDSTMMGNPARFINHSCDPNCYSKVILVDGRKHIVIFALRAIRRGEELTYDYKFPIEDVKIPCSCRSLRCRRYLN